MELATSGQRQDLVYLKADVVSAGVKQAIAEVIRRNRAPEIWPPRRKNWKERSTLSRRSRTASGKT